jgi:hypothetical protein
VSDVLAMLFVNPVTLPAGARMWMLLPLLACVAAVYRATRVRAVRDMPRGTLITFANTLAGMIAIAVAFYLVHLGVRHYL